MKQKLNSFDDPGSKLLTHGTNALSEVENLSIIISGKDALERARKIMSKVNYQYSDLARLSYHDLAEEGLSHAQCLHILACNVYSNRKAIQIAEDRIHIKMSSDIFAIMSPVLSDLTHEEFWIIFLNRNNNVINKTKLSQGGVSGTVTDVRIIMKKAVEHLSSGIILCHNHPSGNLNPSESDTKITQKIKEACNIFDIQLMDHIIVGEKSHYSFADNGML